MRRHPGERSQLGSTEVGGDPRRGNSFAINTEKQCLLNDQKCRWVHILKDGLEPLWDTRPVFRVGDSFSSSELAKLFPNIRAIFPLGRLLHWDVAVIWVASLLERAGMWLRKLQQPGNWALIIVQLPDVVLNWRLLSCYSVGTWQPTVPKTLSMFRDKGGPDSSLLWTRSPSHPTANLGAASGLGLPRGTYNENATKKKQNVCNVIRKGAISSIKSERKCKLWTWVVIKCQTKIMKHAKHRKTTCVQKVKQAE